MVLNGRETQRRARAMLAYAGIELKDMAEQLGLSEDTMGRHAGNRDDYAKRPNLGYLSAIADACDMPMDFFYVQWEDLRKILPKGARVTERRQDGENMWPDLPRRGVGSSGSQAG